MVKARSEVPKSQHIRDILLKNPSTPVREVISTLGARGIKVKKGLVYFVKGQMKGQNPKQDKDKAPASANGKTMSTKQKPQVTRSQIIREFLMQHPAMSVTEVVTMLGKKGIAVSKGHVYLEKGKLQAKLQRAQEELKANSAATSQGKSEVTKSQLIRDYIVAHPQKSLSEVVADFAERGIPVSKNLVYVVKSKMRAKKHREAKQEAAEAVAATPTAAPGSADVVTTIKKIKSLASETGGMKTLKALVDALAE